MLFLTSGGIILAYKNEYDKYISELLKDFIDFRELANNENVEHLFIDTNNLRM